MQAKTEAPAAEASKGKPISVTFFGRVANETEILIPTGYRGGYCFSSVKSQSTPLVLFAESSISHDFSWVVTCAFRLARKAFGFKFREGFRASQSCVLQATEAPAPPAEAATTAVILKQPQENGHNDFFKLDLK